MIPALRTLAGDIPLSSVGGILPHEHITVDLTPIAEGGNRRPPRDLVWDDLLAKLRAARASGIDTLVECTPPHLGRDVALLRDLGEAADVRILLATGLYRSEWQPDDLRTAAAGDIAAWMEQEVGGGFIEGGAWARAGFIKLATSPDALEPAEAKAIEAGALASRATGAALMIHCGVAARALEVLVVLQDAGADPSRAIFAHMDNDPNVDALVDVARRGAHVEFDHIGVADDADVINRVRRLADAGLLPNVLLSQDVCGHIEGRGSGGDGRSYTYLPETFATRLRGAGFSRDETRQVLRENPVRALALYAP